MGAAGVRPAVRAGPPGGGEVAGRGEHVQRAPGGGGPRRGEGGGAALGGAAAALRGAAVSVVGDGFRAGTAVGVAALGEVPRGGVCACAVPVAVCGGGGAVECARVPGPGLEFAESPLVS